MRWEETKNDRSVWVLRRADGAWVGEAYPDGHWCAAGDGGLGHADAPTLAAAKAAVEAWLWTQAAQGLVGR